jgi:hypothetical protein
MYLNIIHLTDARGHSTVQRFNASQCWRGEAGTELTRHAEIRRPAQRATRRLLFVPVPRMAAMPSLSRKRAKDALGNKLTTTVTVPPSLRDNHPQPSVRDAVTGAARANTAGDAGPGAGASA